MFFPGCKIKVRYPEASAWLADQVVARGWVDEVAGCCRVNHQKLTPDDTAVCACNNCMAMIDEDADNGALDNVWQLIDALDSAGVIEHVMIIGAWAEWLYSGYFSAIAGGGDYHVDIGRR